MNELTPNDLITETDYMKYRGKCKEMAQALCEQHSGWTLERGYYLCPFWGKQAHW